jgi:hypothetical protein
MSKTPEATPNSNLGTRPLASVDAVFFLTLGLLAIAIGIGIMVR